MLLSDIKKIENGRILVGDEQDGFKKTQDVSIEIDFQGLPIVIENKKGSVRNWETEEGDTGKTKMFHPYGYIKKTEGTDGDEIDCFVGPDKDSSRVFVIAHMIDGEYDEDKVMLGFSDKEHARDAFLAHYDNASHLGKITEMEFEDFKTLLEKHMDGKRLTRDSYFKDGQSANKRY
jgi:inorganic pyrophosphatase